MICGPSRPSQKGLIRSILYRGSNSHLFCGISPNLTVNFTDDNQSLTLFMDECRNGREGISLVTGDGFGLRLR